MTSRDNVEAVMKTACTIIIRAGTRPARPAGGGAESFHCTPENLYFMVDYMAIKLAKLIWTGNDVIMLPFL